jgi:hypothetical protein
MNTIVDYDLDWSSIPAACWAQVQYRRPATPTVIEAINVCTLKAEIACVKTGGDDCTLVPLPAGYENVKVQIHKLAPIDCGPSNWTFVATWYDETC